MEARNMLLAGNELDIIELVRDSIRAERAAVRGYGSRVERSSVVSFLRERGLSEIAAEIEAGAHELGALVA